MTTKKHADRVREASKARLAALHGIEAHHKSVGQVVDQAIKRARMSLEHKTSEDK